MAGYGFDPETQAQLARAMEDIEGTQLDQIPASVIENNPEILARAQKILGIKADVISAEEKGEQRG
jgi:hypothetical protein